MSKNPPAAIIGPARTANQPTGRLGRLCMPNSAWHGKRSNRPSSIIARAPPSPSSAGWKMKLTVPSKLRVSASAFAAPSSMAVWPSWPQACILPALRERCAKVVGLLDRQRVHVGAQADGPRALARAQHAHHPGAADAAVHLEAERLELVGHDPRGARLLEAELGMGVDVAPPGGHLAVQARDGWVDGHGRRFPPATLAHGARAYQPQPKGDWRLETRPASVKNTDPPPVPG